MTAPDPPPTSSAPSPPPARPSAPRRLRRRGRELASGATAAWQALRGWIAAHGPVILIVAAALATAIAILQPTPPKQLTLATGVDQGAYAAFGVRYAELLRRHGIAVTLRPTQGAADNLQLLSDPASGVDVAFVQGGTREQRAGNPEDEDDGGGLRSLGSLFHEPVWLFYRTDSARRLLAGASPAATLTNLRQLAGWRLNVGAPGSGVPPLMAQLLQAHGLAPNAVTLSQQSTTPAVVDFLAGRLDALALASAPESSMVQMLLRTPGVQLFDFAQADAYVRRFPFMSRVTLPRGLVDLGRDMPPHDIRLVAPTATLLARESLHPALVQLLVQAAQEVHGGAGWFRQQGEFPNVAHTEWPLAAEAQRFYRNGVPWLQRYLPFWVANFVDRMWIVLLSIVAIALPLSRVLPPLVEFRIRSRVFRWYAQLREIEDAAATQPREDVQAALDEVEARVARISVPLSYADELYALRSHIQLVRRRLLGREPAAAAGEPPVADEAMGAAGAAAPS